MHSFNSVRKEFGIGATKMKELMRKCGFEPDINATFTDEQYDALYDVLSEMSEEPKGITADDMAKRLGISLESFGDLLAQLEISMPENGLYNDGLDEIITERELELREAFGTSQGISSDDLMREFKLNAEEFGTLLDNCGIKYPHYPKKGVFSDSEAKSIREFFGKLEGIPAEDLMNELNLDADDFSDILNACKIDYPEKGLFTEEQARLIAEVCKNPPSLRVRAIDIMESLGLNEGELRGLLGNCNIDFPSDGMFTKEQAEIITDTAHRGIITPPPPPPPMPPTPTQKIPPRPLAANLPPDEAFEGVQELSEGSIVYRKEGTNSIPYILMDIIPGSENRESISYNIKNKGSNPPSNENLTAKIFLPEARTKRREAKIRAMIRAKLQANNICFPVAILTDSNGVFSGFLMKKAKGEKLSTIIEKLRKRETGHFYSNWTRKDISDLIVSILENVKYLHEHNILFGDICTDNIRVSSTKDVYIINADRFQFLPENTLDDLTDTELLKKKNYSIPGYPCPYGKVRYSPSEFQAILEDNYISDIFRTKSDELFSLSVLIFLIVMMGTYPYDQKGTLKPEEAKKRRQFFYPAFFLNNRAIRDNRRDNYKGIPRYGLANLPDESARIWDHLRPSVKKTFRDAFAFRGEHSSEGTYYTAEEWQKVFIEDSCDITRWSDEDHDPANMEIFPEYFCKPIYRRDENGRLVRDENGGKVKIEYVECRFCHDLVDRSECRGENNDECALCWEDGTEQAKCSRCGKAFLITQREAEKTRKTGRSLRDICDDCMKSPAGREQYYTCSKGHKYKISKREEDMLYWNIWKDITPAERDYDIFCPHCIDVVSCERCHENLTVTKQQKYLMEREGRPFSSVCPHCKPVKVKCEECGEEFTVEKRVQDEMTANGEPFSMICPKNTPVSAECERCHEKFDVKKHDYDKLKPDGKLFTLCPMGEKVKVHCRNCGAEKVHMIERYWAESLKRNGEEYDCGNHKLLSRLLGMSGSTEPPVNHRP